MRFLLTAGIILLHKNFCQSA